MILRYSRCRYQISVTTRVESLILGSGFEGFLWGSIHLLREAVDHYSFQLKHVGQY